MPHFRSAAQDSATVVPPAAASARKPREWSARKPKSADHPAIRMAACNAETTLARRQRRPTSRPERYELMQISTVLIQRRQGYRNPAAVPSVSHILRRFRSVSYTL